MVEWLAGNRIRGTSAEKPALALPSGSVGGWKELARTTLGSAGDTISVASLADKRYYMVLGNHLPSGNFRTTYRFNGDTASNYALRKSENGGAENAKIDQALLEIGNEDTNTDYFDVSYLSNLSAQEKLMINHNMRTGGSGAGNDPNRVEAVAKWDNTSSVINRIDAFNDQGGNYASGSEVVVLGWDPADTHTTNFWEELASVELGSASSTLDSGTFTAKKYLWVQAYINATTVDTGLTFNGDTGTNYARRWSDDGGSDGTATGGNNIQVDRGNSTQFLNIFIVNNSANEKLGMYHTGTQNTAGAGNAPARRELVFKWANTSAQITSMIFTKKGSGTDLQSGSIIKVWGSD
jgi:hypothetical protein